MSVVGQGELTIQRAQALQCSLILLGKRGWFGKDGRGSVCLPEGWTQHLEFKGMQCYGHICPKGPTGEDAALGGRETVFPVSSESCLESEMCRVCT